VGVGDVVAGLDCEWFNDEGRLGIGSMIWLFYIAVIAALAVVVWGVPALILWLFFDMEFRIALLIGGLIGGFLFSLLDAFDFPIMKRKKREKKGGDERTSPTGDGTTPPPGA
jgi:uncharacterized metal-binding protein